MATENRSTKPKGTNPAFRKFEELAKKTVWVPKRKVQEKPHRRAS